MALSCLDKYRANSLNSVTLAAAKIKNYNFSCHENKYLQEPVTAKLIL